MQAHPLPDLKTLSGKSLPIFRWATPLFRVHELKYSTPIYFGRSGINRFDAPKNNFGVMYAAKDMFGAFIETIGHTTGIKIVQQSDLLRRELVELEANRALRLVDLSGKGCARLGVDARLCAGAYYKISQKWSEAFHAHPDSPDGIYYRSRHDPSKFCAAIFQRKSAKLRVVRSHTLDPAVSAFLPKLLDHYLFGLG